MLPKLNFKYSPVYQEVAHLPKGVKYDKNKDWRYTNKFIIKLRNKWNKKLNSI